MYELTFEITILHIVFFILTFIYALVILYKYVSVISTFEDKFTFVQS